MSKLLIKCCRILDKQLDSLRKEKIENGDYYLSNIYFWVSRVDIPTDLNDWENDVFVGEGDVFFRCQLNLSVLQNIIIIPIILG